MKPKVIYIETTNLCNAKCIMCPHEKINRQPFFMEDAVFDKVVADCAEMNLKNAQIFLHKEGEPLLDPNLMDRLKKAALLFGEHNEVGINTNAMLLTRDKTEDFLNTGANLIFFSIDGINKQDYEKIRVNLNYETVVENIRYFLERCSETGKKIRVVMQMLVQSDNDNKSQMFIEQWSKYPCELYIKRMHSYLDGGHSSQSAELEKIQKNICDDPFRMIVIYTNGNAGLCCWDYNNEYSLGNVMEYSIEELFNNDKAVALRKAITERQCDRIVPCNRCARVFGNDKITEY